MLDLLNCTLQFHFRPSLLVPNSLHWGFISFCCASSALVLLYCALLTICTTLKFCRFILNHSKSVSTSGQIVWKVQILSFNFQFITTLAFVSRRGDILWWVEFGEKLLLYVQSSFPERKKTFYNPISKKLDTVQKK